MKFSIAIIVVVTAAFSAGAPPEKQPTPATRAAEAVHPAGKPEFWQDAPGGQGMIAAYIEWIPGYVKVFEAPADQKLDGNAKAASQPDIFRRGKAPCQQFFMRFYLIGAEGTTRQLWTHRGTAAAGSLNPMEIYAVTLTPDAFIIVYDEQTWGMFAAAVRPGARANADDGMPLRGFNLARASISGPLSDGSFCVVAGDEFRPQNRYRARLEGGKAHWEWDGIWNAAALAWHKPGPETQPASLPSSIWRLYPVKPPHPGAEKGSKDVLLRPADRP